MDEIQVIASKIQRLPGRPPFMIDSDLATVYETSTKAINRAVKRNPERFPEDFVFKLTREEAERCFEVTDCDLKEVVTICDQLDVHEESFEVPNWNLKKDGRGGRRYLPYAFSREGANMLSAVLNTEVAVARSVQIMRAFSSLERGDGPVMAALGRVVDLIAGIERRLERLEERISAGTGGGPPTLGAIALPPAPAGAAKRAKRSHLMNGLRFHEVRRMVVSMRQQGAYYREITQAIRDRWPNRPEMHVSRSAIHRFWDGVCCGRFKEFGIEV